MDFPQGYQMAQVNVNEFRKLGTSMNSDVPVFIAISAQRHSRKNKISNSNAFKYLRKIESAAFLTDDADADADGDTIIFKWKIETTSKSVSSSIMYVLLEHN